MSDTRSALGLLGRKVGMTRIFTDDGESVPVTVLDVVLMGRYSRMGWLDFPGKSDLELAHNSLQEMGITDLAQRSLRDLSGGQLQRVFLARALTQQPHSIQSTRRSYSSSFAARTSWLGGRSKSMRRA